MTNEVLGFNIWTKNMPQPFLDSFVEFADRQDLPVVAIVDDVLPAVVFKRSEDESSEYSQAYVHHMQKIGFDQVHLVSELLVDRDKDLTRYYEISSRIGLSAFLGLLPEKKRQALDDLLLTETIDTCWQLSVLESGIIQASVTKYLTGKRSTALFRLAKNTIGGFDFDVIDQ
ncbi:hypothetical protein COU91_02920 [Candidatus Saccharibacteria bacterium CG10_big_fil_rev_8_21_14_0_10_47_8]|nr:MAG: hypothetical protein COU91_02920 [Candidatus Saccharibacteria bacterium CG10_big_fil_rev_8_21_14_0_10_47_8]